MADRTRPIVRLEVMNRMVTKGYQKGVYERVTKGIGVTQPFGGPRKMARIFIAEEGCMTWIRTVSLDEADEKLRQAIEGEKLLYPKEYADPVHPDASGASSIVGSHTLIPEALYHAFATFGALMSPELPLSRRQHEMIATMVSVTNRCVY
jgi:hypothetical protein